MSYEKIETVNKIKSTIHEESVKFKKELEIVKNQVRILVLKNLVDEGEKKCSRDHQHQNGPSRRKNL